MTTPNRRGPGATFWYIVGYGNPNCQGDAVWSEGGSSNQCTDARTLAASYAWVAGQDTRINTWVVPDFCTAQVTGRPVYVVSNTITMDGATGKHGCVDNAAVGGDEVVLL